MKATKTSVKKGSWSQQSLIRVKCGGKGRQIRRKIRKRNIELRQILDLKRATRALKSAAQRLRLKAERQSSAFNSVIKALLGGARVKDVIGFQRVCNEPIHQHVRALPGLARCSIGRGDGAARTADPFSDLSAEPMDIDPEPIGMEPESMDIDSEPMYMESQSVAITIIMTWILFLFSCTLISPLSTQGENS